MGEQHILDAIYTSHEDRNACIIETLEKRIEVLERQMKTLAFSVTILKGEENSNDKSSKT